MTRLDQIRKLVKKLQNMQLCSVMLMGSKYLTWGLSMGVMSQSSTATMTSPSLAPLLAAGLSTPTLSMIRCSPRSSLTTTTFKDWKLLPSGFYSFSAKVEHLLEFSYCGIHAINFHGFTSIGREKFRTTTSCCNRQARPGWDNKGNCVMCWYLYE